MPYASRLFNSEYIEMQKGEVSSEASSFFCPENSFSLDLILSDILKQENFNG